MSFMEEHGEWETRRISVFGAVKSFIGNLSIGQDLMRISMPAVFLNPFSALELGGTRSLHFLPLLLKAATEEDAVKRLLGVVAYVLTTTQKEKFERKPMNPILAENHISWVDLEDGSKVYYIGEQAVHHPPLAAFAVDSKQHGIKVQYNSLFETKFHGNSASVTVQKPFKIELSKWGEEYVSNKAFPDMWVKNVILGTKRIVWEGELIITCAKTGLRAVLTYKEEGWYCQNTLYGRIERTESASLKSSDGKQNSAPLFTLSGICGEVLKISKPNLPNEQTEVFLDFSALKPLRTQYLPEQEWDDKSSLKVWREVALAVIADDMPRADAAKRVVEEAQRKRRNDGTSFVPEYFKLDTESGFWEYQDGGIELFLQKTRENSKKQQGNQASTEAFDVKQLSDALEPCSKEENPLPPLDK